MKQFILILLSSFLLIPEANLNAQTTRRVLFLGNSYTQVNDLPQLIHDVALSVGDTLVFDSNCPGGYSLINHSIDASSQNKIMMSGWDYVVIQGQSQEPITSFIQFGSGASALYNQIKQYNPCAVIMPYMTWGRKNGDAANCANFPIMCTYQGMDTTIRDIYLNLTASMNGVVSPVSVVWNNLRQNHSGIELYQPDESHPSAAGSYAAACCFYTSIFKNDPTLITFNFGLSASDASIIKNTVKTQVFDSLHLWDFKRPPIAKINYQIGSGINEAIFHAIDYGVRQTYIWDFGDGDTSSSAYSPHSYLSDGTYTVTLTTTNCDLQGVHTSFADTIIQFCSHTPTIYTPLPWLCEYDTLWTQAADSYQWYSGEVPLPETNQYIPDYGRYTFGSFSVVATVTGCSEMSEPYTTSPLWSGYYFDSWSANDPCDGDTVPFAVLHNSGFLSGLENILWFKNDTLLPLMMNEDTLFITGPGKYDCKVIDPNSNCPLDTTSASVVIDCSGVGIEHNVQDLSWSIFPNPASETIAIKFTNHSLKEQIQIYSAIGGLTKVIDAMGETTFRIVDLPSGLYFIRIKNNVHPPLKFIKQ